MIMLLGVISLLLCCGIFWKWRNNHIFHDNFQFPIDPKRVVYLNVVEWHNAYQAKKADMVVILFLSGILLPWDVLN